MALLTLQSYFETTSIVLAQNYKEACKKLNQTAYQYFGNHIYFSCRNQIYYTSNKYYFKICIGKGDIFLSNWKFNEAQMSKS